MWCEKTAKAKWCERTPIYAFSGWKAMSHTLTESTKRSA
jgi:hypothetical protein